MTHDENGSLEPGRELLRQTTRFVARRYSRPLLVTCSAIMLAGCGVVVVMAAQQQRALVEWLVPAAGLAAFGMVALLLLGQTYGVYEVGPGHIELQGWTGRRRRIVWREVARIQAISTPTTGFSVQLVDRHGRRIRVDAEVPEGRRLLGVVFCHLASAGKEEMLQAALAKPSIVVSDERPAGKRADAQLIVH